jgi:hypothetical protein
MSDMAIYRQLNHIPGYSITAVDLSGECLSVPTLPPKDQT